jgi:VanZ family protein
MSVAAWLKQRKRLTAISAVLLTVTLISIWVLTVQTPDQTTSLSSFWAALIPGVSPDDASFIVRKLAHIAEFLPVGLFAGLAALCWFGDRLPVRTIVIGTVLFSALCSLGDQTHKLFVPGREFDGRDLVFDVAGYVAGIAIAVAVDAAIKRRAE